MGDLQERLQAQVYGLVQGVSFRYYTLLKASEIGVTGWVRNLPNGSVELMAEGTHAQLEELHRFIRRGPEGACVTHVEFEWTTANGDFHDFQIRR